MNKYTLRTDLADELIKTKPQIEEEIEITKIKIDKETSKKINKKEGTYITLSFKNINEKIKKCLKRELNTLIKNYLKENSLGLIIGLGNEKSTPDSLGPLTIKKILVTNHIYMYDSLEEGFKRTCAIAPGVTGETGIETQVLIKSIKENINPDYIIVIDALASSSVERLNNVIQITDAGISPGSGVGNKRKEISQNTLNVPVIAIGVPTVTTTSTVVKDTLKYLTQNYTFQKNIKPKDKLKIKHNYLNEKINQKDKEELLGLIGKLNEEETINLIYETLNPIGYNFLITPKEEDFIIEKLARLIGESINEIIHTKLTSIK